MGLNQHMPLIAIMGASVPAFLVFILLYMETLLKGECSILILILTLSLGWFISPVGLNHMPLIAIMGATSIPGVHPALHGNLLTG